MPACGGKPYSSWLQGEGREGRAWSSVCKENGPMITNLHELYIHQLQDLYSAEEQILAALPKMITHAQNDELREAFEEHRKETAEQLERVTKLLTLHHQKPGGETCHAIKGLIKEGDHLMSETTGDAVDPGLIASAQRIEHYEMAAYGTAKRFAKHLDYDKDVSCLDETLEEESECNEQLTKIATGGLFTSGVNQAALA